MSILRGIVVDSSCVIDAWQTRHPNSKQLGADAEVLVLFTQRRCQATTCFRASFHRAQHALMLAERTYNVTKGAWEQRYE